VEPRTAVVICTMANSVNNYESEYIAKTSYSVKGWNGNEVRDYLISKGSQFSDLEVSGKYAFKYVQGVYKASLVATTKFYITPKEVQSPCLGV